MVQLTSLLVSTLLAAVVSSSPVPAPDSTNGRSAALSPRQFGDTACAPLIVIFARGTGESPPIGNVVGPQFRAALGTRLGAANVAFQGVSYDASFAGAFVGGSPLGSGAMASMVTQQAASCPRSFIFISGYSQGCQLVHDAGKQLDRATAAAVAGAVLFGDPDYPRPVANVPNLKVFCAAGDLICEGQPIVLPPHLSYGAYADEAAEFVAASVGAY